MIAVLKAGSVVAGRYRLDKKLGQGGMGVVWRATQIALGRSVAVKFILIGNDEPRFREMFAQEAQIASQLNHPSIVPVVEFGEEDDILFLVTVYVAGTDLSRLLSHTPGGLPVPVVFYIALQVLYAVQHAHENHVLHRDLKPGNVLLSPAGGVLLTDFGIAKLIDPRRTPSISTLVKGSPGYMAPEVLRGLAAGFPADLFALGGLVWECLTGRNPFTDESNERERIFYNTLNLRLPPISSLVPVPAGLDAFLARALAKEPGQRHQSAQEAIDELLAIGAPFSHEATTPGELRKLLRSAMETQVEPLWHPPGLTPLAGQPPLPSLRTSGMAGQVVAANARTATSAETSRRRRGLVGAAIAGVVAAGIAGVVWVGNRTAERPVATAKAPVSPALAPPAEPDARPTPQPARPGRLTISVVPLDAKVFVDEQSIEEGPPYVVTSRPDGTTVRVRVERQGYVTQVLEVGIGDDTRRSIQLEAKPKINTSKHRKRTVEEKEEASPSPTTPIFPPPEK